MIMGDKGKSEISKEDDYDPFEHRKVEKPSS